MPDSFPKDWQLLPLEQCMAAIIDYRGKSPNKTESGVPLITAKIVKGGRIAEPEEFIAEDAYDDWMRRGIPQAGDILMTTEAPLGEVAQLDGRKVALAQRLITLRGRPRLLDNTYLKFLMQSAYVQEQLRARSTGTTVLGIRQSELRRISLVLPPLAEQRAIAHLLGTLDNKIELNRRINETLQAVAQTIFKSWFVDTAKVALPNGWREGTVSDLANLSRTTLHPAEFPNETFDHYSIPAFDEGRTPKPERGDAIKSNKFLLPLNSVMVSKLNPRIPRVWLPDLRRPNRAVCSTEFLVLLPKLAVSREYLFCLLKADSFVRVFATMVTGTSSSHQRVGPDSLLAMKVLIPPQPLVQRFTANVAPLLTRIAHNISESNTLSGLRDTLLPSLFSGQLRLNAP